MGFAVAKAHVDAATIGYISLCWRDLECGNFIGPRKDSLAQSQFRLKLRNTFRLNRPPSSSHHTFEFQTRSRVFKNLSLGFFSSV